MWKISSLFFSLLLLVGLYLGLGGVAGIIVAITGNQPGALWPAIGIHVAGLALAAGSGLMVAKSLSRASENTKDLLVRIGLFACGAVMLWIGLGLLGIDPMQTFGQGERPMDTLLLGIVMTFLGVGLLFLGIAGQKQEVAVLVILVHD